MKFRSGKYFSTAMNGLSDEENNKRMRVSQLLEKDKVKKVILSSYAWDDQWLQGLLPHNTPICMIRNDITSYPFSDQVIIVNPAIDGFGFFHAKLLALEFDFFVRIAVLTGNFVPVDWYAIENMVFVQDFPKSLEAKEQSDGFISDFVHSLQEMGVPPNFLDFMTTGKLDNQECRVELVFSRNGSFYKFPNYGLIKLGDFASKKCGINEETKLKLIFTTSSLASMDEEYVHFFSSVLRGHRTTRTKRYLDQFHVLYPTEETVLSNYHGILAAHCIFLSEKNYLKFPKSILYRYESESGPFLLHGKIIVCLKDQKTFNENENIGFYYLGSHNFTKAAWGFQTNNGYWKVCNYELGVVEAMTTRTVASGRYPKPYSSKLEPYREGVDKPWISEK